MSEPISGAELLRRKQEGLCLLCGAWSLKDACDWCRKIEAEKKRKAKEKP
jgi:hypothetical protein